MKFRHRSRHSSILAIGLILMTLLMTAQPVLLVQAQRASSRMISKTMTSTARGLSNHAKGEIGEHNIRSALRTLPRKYLLDERYIRRGVLDKGIDAIYRSVKGTRFNIVEAKATSSTGRLGLGILPTRVGGERQMDSVWIRKKLSEAEQSAARTLADNATTTQQRRMAENTLQMITSINQRKIARHEKTLVVTRLQGVDRKYLNPSRRIFDSINPSLRGKLDNVIEVNRNGRVLAVYPLSGTPRTP